MTNSRKKGGRASKPAPARPSKPAPAPKRERGRPVLADEERRDQRLVVKLRVDEKAQLQAEADAKGLPLMIYCRLLLFRKGIPDAR